MDKEKEIEEMVEIARKHSENFANTPYYKGVYTDMEAIYNAGYRKADEVRKEYEEEIMVLTAQVDVLQSERDNLMRTLEEANEELQADAFLEALKGEKNGD